jgi:hypothetical protein
MRSTCPLIIPVGCIILLKGYLVKGTDFEALTYIIFRSFGVPSRSSGYVFRIEGYEKCIQKFDEEIFSESGNFEEQERDGRPALTYS